MVRRLFARGINRADPKVSPFFQPDLAGNAPAFIVTADHDPMRDEGNEYAAKLKAAKVPVDYTCWPGMIHGLASFAGVLDAGPLLIDQIALRSAMHSWRRPRPRDKLGRRVGIQALSSIPRCAFI